MGPSLFLLALHLAVTAFMTGLVWFVQVVHYPLFARVGAPAFAAYARAHQASTLRVVAPPMLLEAVLTVWTLTPASGVPAPLASAGAGLLAAIWLSTAALQVPLHGRLAAGFDTRAQRRLVASNWIRTAAWTLRTTIAGWMLAAAGAPA